MVYLMFVKAKFFCKLWNFCGQHYVYPKSACRHGLVCSYISNINVADIR